MSSSIEQLLTPLVLQESLVADQGDTASTFRGLRESQQRPTEYDNHVLRHVGKRRRKDKVVEWQLTGADSGAIQLHNSAVQSLRIGQRNQNAVTLHTVKDLTCPLHTFCARSFFQDLLLQACFLAQTLLQPLNTYSPRCATYVCRQPHRVGNRGISRLFSVE